MKTTRAFIASVGVSALLIGSSVAMLAVVSAVLAYRGIPGTTTPIPLRAVVATPTSQRPLEPIQLTKADIQAANEPRGGSQAAQASNNLPGSSGGGASPSGSPSGVPTSSNSGSGNPDPAPEVQDPSAGPNPGNDPLERVRDVPQAVRDTVNEVDLGKGGREVTRKLSDDVVSKVSPKLGDTVKKTTEPLWKTLDRP